MNKVGCHVSIGKGYLEAAKTADRVGALSYQYFPKNPKSLKLKAFDPIDAKACAVFCHNRNIISIAHSPYPTNLAIESEPMKQAVHDSLVNDLEIAEMCGSIGVVVHFGKYKGKDTLQGYKNILQLLNTVLTSYQGPALILLENQAGEGTMMGTTMEEHVQIRSMVSHPDQIGFCLDTCHAFASGLWNEENWDTLEWQGKSLHYFTHLKVVHLNDSVYPSGSCRDRHANIGQGYIGEDRLKTLIHSEGIRNLPLILETNIDKGQTHAQEIRLVNHMIMK